MKMEALDWCIEALALLDTCLNSYCFYYVQKTFNINQCMNYILCIDSSLTAIVSLLIFVTNLIKMPPTPFICSLVTLALLIVSSLFVNYNFILAYIRYNRIWTSMNNMSIWKTDKQMIKVTNFSLIFTTILLVSMIIFNAHFDWRLISLYNQCMGSNEIAITGLIVNSIRLFIIICTVVLDTKSLLLVRTFKNKPKISSITTNGILTETPCRATLLNSMVTPVLRKYSLVPRCRFV